MAFLLSTSEASAEGIQAQCGREDGQAYAFEGGLVSSESAGWYADSMRGETIIRVNTDTGEVDIRFKDATGIWQSVTDQGGFADFWAAEAATGAFMVVAMYPGATVETLVVGNIDHIAGTGELAHTVTRVTDRISNARVMVADCRVTPF